MRVCVLARPCPGSWVDPYVAAFRRCCDTLVVGEAPGAEKLAEMNRPGLAGERVDIPCGFDQPFDLLARLPEGWRPDLVVGISGLGGAPLYPGVAALPCPTAFLTIDTWQCLYDYSEARQYDFVFAAQRSFLPRLHDAGSHRVHWLPLACDPEAHAPAPGAPTHDIAFAGSFSQPVHARRRQLLEALGVRFSVFAEENVFGPALNAAMARGRLAFNHCAVREVNMRVFEAMAMGRPLLNNAEAADNGLLDLFEDGAHLALYDGESDLIDRAAALLADEPARRRMAEAGRARVLAEHTYDHRVATVIDTIAAHRAPDHDTRHGWACRGTRLHDYLPWAPGVLVDYGLGLRASRIALRRRGVTEYVGCALGQGDTRRASCDTFLAEGLPPGETADTFAVDARGRDGAFLEEGLRAARAVLVPGGNLLLAVDTGQAAATGEARAAWLLAHGFHRRFESLPLENGGFILGGRKRTRALRDMARELYAVLAVPGVDPEELHARIPASW